MTSVVDINPELWEGSEGGRSAGFCQFVFALSHYDGTRAYLVWANQGRPFEALQKAYDEALEVLDESDERMAYLKNIGKRFSLTH